MTLKKKRKLLLQCVKLGLKLGLGNIKAICTEYTWQVTCSNITELSVRKYHLKFTEFNRDGAVPTIIVELYRNDHLCERLSYMPDADSRPGTDSILGKNLKNISEKYNLSWDDTEE